MASVATVEQFGLLVVPWRQIELLGQGCEGCDFPFSHGSVVAAGDTFRTVREETNLWKGLAAEAGRREGLLQSTGRLVSL